MNTPAETTMDKIFHTATPPPSVPANNTTAAPPATGSTTTVPTKRKRGETPNVEADVFPGTRWHGRRESSRQYTAVVKSHPFEADGRTYLQAAVTGKITRNGTQLMETFLSEFARDPDDKQDPSVLGLEKAARAQHANLAAITHDATIEPATSPATAATAPVEPITIGEIRSSDGSGTVGTITRIRILSRSVSEPDAYVVEAGWPSIVPNDKWKGIVTADDLRRYYPVVKSGVQCAILPPTVRNDGGAVIPGWLTAHKTTPQHGVERGQVRSTGGILGGSVTKVYVSSDPDGEGRYKVLARYPSVVDRPTWEVRLTAAEIAHVWPNVTGVMSIAWVRGAIVSPGEYKAPTFAMTLTEIVPEPVKLGQIRSEHSLGTPVSIASFLAGSLQYVVRCPTNGQGPSLVELLTADEIEHAYPVVLEQPGRPGECVVPGQFRDGLPGFIARVEVVGYNPGDDTFVLRAATPREALQSEWCHRFTTGSILTKWPKLSAVQGPVDETTKQPEAPAKPMPCPAQIKTAIVDVLGRAPGGALVSYVVKTVCGDIGCSALDVLTWGDDLCANSEIEPVICDGPGTFWRIMKPSLNGEAIANAILGIVRDATTDGIRVTHALARLRGNLEIDPIAALVVARELAADGKIHFIANPDTWYIGPEPINPSAPVMTEDQRILSSIDGWTANKLRIWAKAMPHDIHTIYGVGDVTVPVSVAQVIRVLAMRADGGPGRESKGLVL